MVVSPHRDDETIGCGGTICAHTERGDHGAVVHICGEGGASLAEARSAAGILGVSEISTLSCRVGQPTPTRELLLELVMAFRQHRPQIVYVPHEADADPTHKLTSALVREARWLAGHPALPEAGEPAEGFAPIVYEFEVWTPLARPTAFVDISRHVERKAAALNCCPSRMGINEWSEGALGLARYRGVTSGQGDHVEAFAVVGAPPCVVSASAPRAQTRSSHLSRRGRGRWPYRTVLRGGQADAPRAAHARGGEEGAQGDR
ncbi:PIG-L deacetylase family protein [Streptomyces sp. NPDC051217]|uniref:PIG-L deacetylase family protein n=1 Tax=Streptomyces sp. NPDC051217 TaxID=3365644 RepID=UPI0037A77ACB